MTLWQDNWKTGMTSQTFSNPVWIVPNNWVFWHPLVCRNFFSIYITISTVTSVCLSIRPWFRHKIFFSPNQQMLLIDVVTYASVMTKMCSASSLDPPPPGALGGGGGKGARAGEFTAKVGKMKKKLTKFTKCFSDKNNHPELWGYPQGALEYFLI